MINISTAAIHNFDAAANRPNYSASKSAGNILVQQIAQGVSADDMQVNSFHPGAIFTAAAKNAGYTADTLPWDEGKKLGNLKDGHNWRVSALILNSAAEDLPGDYAVWAASDEAKFLHGRFTWAAWDVDEVAAGPIRENITANSHYLKSGIVGI